MLHGKITNKEYFAMWELHDKAMHTKDKNELIKSYQKKEKMNEK